MYLNHPQTVPCPGSVEKLFPTKLVPGAKKLGTPGRHLNIEAQPFPLWSLVQCRYLVVIVIATSSGETVVGVGQALMMRPLVHSICIKPPLQHVFPRALHPDHLRLSLPMPFAAQLHQGGSALA